MNNRKADMTARTKRKSEKPAPAESEDVTLELALAEEDEGDTPESAYRNQLKILDRPTQGVNLPVVADFLIGSNLRHADP
jgi:hypothetical protein